MLVGRATPGSASTGGREVRPGERRWRRHRPRRHPPVWYDSDQSDQDEGCFRDLLQYTYVPRERVILDNPRVKHDRRRRSWWAAHNRTIVAHYSLLAACQLGGYLSRKRFLHRSTIRHKPPPKIPYRTWLSFSEVACTSSCGRTVPVHRTVDIRSSEVLCTAGILFRNRLH